MGFDEPSQAFGPAFEIGGCQCFIEFFVLLFGVSNFRQGFLRLFCGVFDINGFWFLRLFFTLTLCLLLCAGLLRVGLPAAEMPSAPIENANKNRIFIACVS